jgi:radical SAM protein with 4Fe4S-binding SPASM domain
MPMELFDRVLSEYAAIGGGYLSLTPMVGEVFLDRFLPERIDRAAACPAIRGISITTNATHADRFGKAELAAMLRSLCKVQISIYGIDAEEHRALAKRDDHERVLRSVGTIIEACGRPDKVSITVRNLRQREDDEVREWVRATFGDSVSVSHMTGSYSNWGGLFDAGSQLPMGGRWLPSGENTGQCLIPIVAYQVFVNGDVSFCPCCDYNSHPDFALGNIREQSLADICDSPRVRQLWAENEDSSLPGPCRTCTFHVPVEAVGGHVFMFEEPLRFIGG